MLLLHPSWSLLGAWLPARLSVSKSWPLCPCCLLSFSLLNMMNSFRTVSKHCWRCPFRGQLSFVLSLDLFFANLFFFL